MTEHDDAVTCSSGLQRVGPIDLSGFFDDAHGPLSRFNEPATQRVEFTFHARRLLFGSVRNGWVTFPARLSWLSGTEFNLSPIGPVDTKAAPWWERALYRVAGLWSWGKGADDARA